MRQSMLRRNYLAVHACTIVALVFTTAAGAFTATRAAHEVIGKMRAEARP
jgi:hypothetical protein